MDSIVRLPETENPFASGDVWKLGKHAQPKSQHRNWLVQVEAPNLQHDSGSVNVGSMMTITVLGVEFAQWIMEILTKN